MTKAKEPIPAEPKYWHPTCYVCKSPKVANESHCDSRMCPWCSKCKAREKKAQ